MSSRQQKLLNSGALRPASCRLANLSARTTIELVSARMRLASPPRTAQVTILGLNASRGMAQMSSVDSHAARLLSATLMFDRASLMALEALAAESDRRVLRRGEVLVREGEPADRFLHRAVRSLYGAQRRFGWPRSPRSHRANSSARLVSSQDCPARRLSLQHAIRSSLKSVAIISRRRPRLCRA